MGPILVTGAAGSIGSEVSRMLVQSGHRVIALDQAETPLFWLQKELGEGVVPIIGSVNDPNLLHRIMKAFGIAGVVHAAALKHVGMCERNIMAAVETNVFGTARLRHATAQWGVPMVLISTDKAVNPTSVMGATKRVAELVASAMGNARIVRLVNIWNSSGSLVPVVAKQIASGGPVTITDPDARRYFMTAEEASDLVIQALYARPLPNARLMIPAVQNRQQRVGDVVRGLINDFQVGIVVTGLQPGEKLVEELVTKAEAAQMVDNVMPLPPWRGKLFRLSSLISMAEAEAVKAELFKLVGEGNAQ